MPGKHVPKLNAEENRAKRRNENAQILSSILPSVPLVIWWEKLLGQQQATLSWCRTESVSVPSWKGGLGGSYHTLLSFQAFVEFIFPNP